MPTKKIFSWAAVVFWMALIFFLSHQPAAESSRLSQGITEVLIQTIERIAQDAEIDLRSVNHFVRKNAHFAVFMVLGLLVLNALRSSGVTGTRGAALALGICILYAISDEVHQLFIPGRSGEVVDVLIDTAGASVGIGVYWIIIGRIKNRGKF